MIIYIIIYLRSDANDIGKMSTCNLLLPIVVGNYLMRRMRRTEIFEANSSTRWWVLVLVLVYLRIDWWRYLLLASGNWYHLLSLRATYLCSKYLVMVRLHVRSKQISSKVALVADVALIRPERNINDYKLTFRCCVYARGLSNYPD